MPQKHPHRSYVSGSTTAREQVVLGAKPCFHHPGADRVPRLLSNLEFDRALCFALRHDRSRADPTAVGNIPNAECHQVATAQLAVDSEIEEGEIPGAVFQLQPEANRPTLLRL
jgi:hypothetical protein